MKQDTDPKRPYDPAEVSTSTSKRREGNGGIGSREPAQMANGTTIDRLGAMMNGLRRLATILLILGISAPLVQGQESVQKILRQDSTLNNLVDPPGYQSATIGALGGVLRAGTGTRVMVLIPGLGFSGSIFNEFMDRFADECRMYAVTLPGFGGTAAPPSPNNGTSFGEQSWTNSALVGIEQLMNQENIQEMIIVGHWLTGTQLALRLAMKHPDKVKAVVLLAGSARSFSTDTTYAKYYGTLERRVATIDRYLAPRWFKTVTRETWDDNNFLPGDYAVNPVRGLRLWREAATPPLHVWVRYLCEFHAQDIALELDKLTVPTLLLLPGLEGLWYDGTNYMEDIFGYKGWKGTVENNPHITVTVVPDSRSCLWFDQPQEVHTLVADFLSRAR